MAPITSLNQGRAQGVLIANTVFIALPLPFVAMRLWARRITRVGLVLNDYLIIAALILSMAFSATMIIGAIQGGVGQHIVDLSSDELVINLKTAFTATLLWPSANSLVKLSILHFYRTIFTTKTTVMATYVVAALTLMFWLGTLATAFGICVPLEYNWNKDIAGHCGGDTWSWYLSTAVINLVLDVFIIILPLPCVWNLHMRTSRKISLTMIFSFGAIICVVSIIRCASMWSYQTTDFTYNEVLNSVTSTLEPTLGVISACLPVLQPVLSRFPHSSVIIRIRRVSGKIRSGLRREGKWRDVKKLSGVRFEFHMYGLKAHESPVEAEVATMSDAHSVIGQAV